MIAVVDARPPTAAQLTVPPEALEPGVQVYDAEGGLVAGSIERPARDDGRATSEHGRRRRTATANGDEVRLLAVPFTTGGADGRGGGQPGHGAVRALRAVRPARHRGCSAVIVIAGSALIALRVTRQALAPVTQMAERAADWSEHDLDRRFDLGPPTNELAALGETLDHLLDRVASAILSEQRLTAELAHELRTPLTSIQGSADLALLRGVDDPRPRQDLEQIAASADAMSGVITTLLDISRSGEASTTLQTCLAAEVLADVASDVQRSTPEGVLITVRPGGSTARIAGPRELVSRAVLPVAVNAVRHANAGVVLAARDLGDRVELSVTDDGAGIDPDLGDAVFEPGISTYDDGAGLGLGIARRVARSLGGEVLLSPNGDASGARFVISLPRRG